MASVREELGLLVGKYGHELISKTLKQLQERDYSFLTSVCSQPPKTPTSSESQETPKEEKPPKQKKKVTLATSLTPQESKASDSNQEESSQTDLYSKTVKINIVKDPETPPLTTGQGDKSPLTEEQLTRTSSNTAREIPIPPKGLAPKEIKRWQKEKEDALYQELVSKGIKPETLLSKENLEHWVQTEGLTYASIARGRCGLPETQVSSVAKSLGILSHVSQLRAGLINKD